MGSLLSCVWGRNLRQEMVGLSIARRFTMLGVGNKPIVFIPKELYFPVFNLKL